MFNQTIRPRRLRTSAGLRKLVRETRISPESLIWPIFVVEGENIYEEIPSLPGQYHYSPDQLYRMVERAKAHGVTRVILFGLPKDKDEIGSGAWATDGIVQQGIRKIKELAPEMYVVTDVCMCEYTSHGHCGILCDHYVDNDQTIERLAQIALSHAEAGADMVAPSDMMDGRVAAIREKLDANGFVNVPIMSYAAKYASFFYGPFRDAAGSAPSFGDRRSYQMDWHNGREAMRECELDVQEGADILMIKPALSYLDLVYQCKQRFDLPVAAYAVSGEYAMIKATAKAGLIDEYGVMCESAVSIYRAGADILITYFACELADAIRKGDIG
ncbi:porphobilinogen synthase [Butyricicoccus sp. Marseille-Q5471]|uniref:porphobilinogen synthase n=1 Tax=Butyricicoccus sp. Marseille-Q5471 TaxID=3039493 RepID=UPI0024BCF477|nr:porphobilinogen synthase [Butyricicoccus sp. Marseille-Q5471]